MKKADFPNEEILFTDEVEALKLSFDGAVNQAGRGIGFVLLSPEGVEIPRAFQLCFEASNNAAEYEALIAGIHAAIRLGVKRLDVTGDSLLVINHAKGEWQVREPRLMPYCELVHKLSAQFDRIRFEHVPRSNNILVDALARLGSLISFPLYRSEESILVGRLHQPVHQTVWYEHYDQKEDVPYPWIVRSIPWTLKELYADSSEYYNAFEAEACLIQEFPPASLFPSILFLDHRSCP